MKLPKNILLFTVFFSTNLSAQSYKAKIEQHREEYKAEFLKSSNSPLKQKDLAGLRFYEPNEKYKVECTFAATKGGKPFEVPTTSGDSQTYTRFGQLSFQIDGQTHKLTVYRSPSLMNNPLYRDYLFVPFKDQTNGKDTYGGGRYIDLRMREVNGDKVILDFNKAYNPYCAFGDGYSCPIPPKENHLKIAIEAGEKNYSKTGL
ncbi:MAG: DUF1684 domain-containing protein [Spirosomaceae bacterium]|jgi:hypothetical protein|nr:DUF1684 domain-containing protein [Spirosomataceae bacterium]